MPGTNENELRQVNTAAGNETSENAAISGSSVKKFDATSETQLRDIKPLMNMNIEYKSAWPYIAASLFAAALIYIIWRQLAKKAPEDKPVFEEIKPPAPPPFDIAVSELERLEQSGLLEKGEIKLWYMGISRIFRIYIGGLLEFNCVDLDISEIMPVLRKASVRSSYCLEIEDILNECDLVKFARYAPDKNMALEIYKKVFEFVKKNGNNNLK